MTIEFIDPALNVVLTGLLYGSEAWMIGAFGLYVATHRRPTSLSVSATSCATMGMTGTDAEVTPQKAAQATSQTELTAPIFSDLEDPVQIVCQPVDWKKWKVGDLRKANIAKACGVQPRPIGSSRNLSRADLIAQYEQQLNRFTQLPATARAKQKTWEREKIIA